jgi:hypothetical protein
VDAVLRFELIEKRLNIADGIIASGHDGQFKFYHVCLR